MPLTHHMCTCHTYTALATHTLHLLHIHCTCYTYTARVTHTLHLQHIHCTCNAYTSLATHTLHLLRIHCTCYTLAHMRIMLKHVHRQTLRPEWTGFAPRDSNGYHKRSKVCTLIEWGLCAHVRTGATKRYDEVCALINCRPLHPLTEPAATRWTQQTRQWQEPGACTVLVWPVWFRALSGFLEVGRLACHADHLYVLQSDTPAITQGRLKVTLALLLPLKTQVNVPFFVCAVLVVQV